MSALFGFSFDFHHFQCYKCKQPFAISAGKYKRCMNYGETFYCPDGHAQVLTDLPTAKLERELQKEKQRREWAERERDEAHKREQKQEYRARAYKGKLTHVKRRVGNGVCPCCNRTFQNLMAHMKTQHPGYKSAE